MNIYLDSAATTKVAPEVGREMASFFEKHYANPSSVHEFGIEVKECLSRARAVIGSSVGAKQKEIIFTGSGTEANNLALKGLFFSQFPEKNHIITTKIEHDCVLNACKWIETQGGSVTYLDVDEQGFVDPNAIEGAITEKTFLVSIIHANNEIGTIQDLKQISAVCHKKNVLFHTDACQSYTKVPIDVEQNGIDLLTINAHKIHGPKGVGALFVRSGVRITPLLHGGGQEFGLRSSTENVPGIMGFAKAVETASIKDVAKMTELRDWLIGELLSIEKVVLNGPVGEKRLCNNVNVSFFMVEGEQIQARLSKQGIFVSTGSACSSNSQDVSHVMKAIQSSMEYLHGNIRISLSKYTTKKELQLVVKEVKKILGESNLKEVV